MRQLGFVLDLDRCTGCAACVIACTTENRPGDGIAWRAITTFNSGRLPGAPVFHYSLACNHCLEPSCMAGCPADAYTKDAATGAVLIDRDRCIGCRYCAWVCPYSAPQFDDDAGLMEKCTFCRHRLEVDLAPACVVACPLDALKFEPMEAPATVAKAGFPETGLKPAVRVVGQRRRSPPELTAAPDSDIARPRRQRAGWKGFRAEWSLWAFTSIITFLAAWFAAATSVGRAVSVPAFAAAGFAAIAISALHLGRPGRAWRGILNWRRSWISREALLVVGFVLAGVAVTAAAPSSMPALWATAATGFAALFAMDMVYRVPGQPVQTVPHSAMATLTGSYYLGLLVAAPAIVLPAASVKVALYLARRGDVEPRHRGVAAVRILLGLALPCTLVFVNGLSPWILAAPAVAGELIDRAQFYTELEFLTPKIQVARDLVTLERSNV